MTGFSQTGPEMTSLERSFGLYVHIPFCTSRCDYCAFATWTGREDSIDAYVDAVVSELEAARKEPGWRNPDTVFFGGGTPSLLAPCHFERILNVGVPVPGAEITIECNPESTDLALLTGLITLGVNRVSLGVQSRKRHVLAGLGRHYEEGSFERALDAIERSGITNYNVDVVVGGAGERTEDVQGTIEELVSVELAPSHVSAYALTVEPGTPLAKDPLRHPDDDDQAERYELVDEILSGAGYRWYEVSNWAKPGRECRHNLSCWLGGDYRGVGCAAHSHLGGERFSNVFSLDRYLQAIGERRSPKAMTERLADEEHDLELLGLLLRTRYGVPCDALSPEVVELGLAEGVEGRYVLTRRGRLLANEVALRLRLPGQKVTILPR